MEVLGHIAVTLDAPSLMNTVHVRADSEDGRRFRALVDQAGPLARPKALYRECFIDACGEDTVVIAAVTFRSRALAKHLRAAHRVFPYVATCGRELDQVSIAREDPLEQYWLDAIKTAALGEAIRHLHDRMDRRHGLGKTAAMHPGSGDRGVWPIEQQRELFLLLGDVQRLVGVELTESCLMIPGKSVSGIRFPTEVDFRSCQLCHRENCPSRSAPFDPELWEAVG